MCPIQEQPITVPIEFLAMEYPVAVDANIDRIIHTTD